MGYTIPIILGGLALMSALPKGKQTVSIPSAPQPPAPMAPQVPHPTQLEEGSNITISPSPGSDKSIDGHRLEARDAWAARYRALVSNPETAPEAHAILWYEWNNENNPVRNLFPNPFALLFDLATYKPQQSVASGFNIEWNSAPLYHGGILDWWNGNTNFWGCQDWITWHQKLEQHYKSTKKANQIWLAAWRDERNWTTENSWAYWGASFVVSMPPAALCPSSSNCWFLEYLYKKGIDVYYFFSNFSCTLTDFGKNIVGAAGSLATGFNTTSKIVAIGLPVGIAAFIYYKIRKMNG